MHTYEYILTVPLDYGPKLLSLDARIACDYLSKYSYCDVFRMPALLTIIEIAHAQPVSIKTNLLQKAMGRLD